MHFTGQVSNTLRFFGALFRMSLKANVSRRTAFAMQVGFMALNNLIFFAFWWLLFQRVPQIRGFALGDIAVLYGLVAASFGLVVTFAGGVRYLGRMIDEGELDSLLGQPKPTLGYALGMRSQAAGIGDVLSGAALLAFSGQIGLSELPWVLFALVLSASVFLTTGVLFFSSAFWLGRTDGIARQLWELLITFSLYPEPLFGGSLRLLLFTLLPAGFVAYLPARIIRNPSLSEVALLVAGSVLYAALATWTFRRGLVRYSSGSRFGVIG